ncbi:MAG: VWA domain-containing protein, partial [Desulfobacteraceae bacterium]|nr:VWA domain-containing protein [Desulfobacteraceae bacterium]
VILTFSFTEALAVTENFSSSGDVYVAPGPCSAPGAQIEYLNNVNNIPKAWKVVKTGDRYCEEGIRESGFRLKGRNGRPSSFLFVDDGDEGFPDADGNYCTAVNTYQFVSTWNYLDSDQVTYNNANSAYYKIVLDVPEDAIGPKFDIDINADDQAVCFINGKPFTGSMTVPTGTCYNFWTPECNMNVFDCCECTDDNCDSWECNKPNCECPYDFCDWNTNNQIVAWPDTDSFYGKKLQQGKNELVCAVAGDASWFEPTGVQFKGRIYYDLPVPEIDIKKYVSSDETNWTDADLPTGLDVITGETVWFKFEVKNTGDAPLTDITINDNIFGPVTCGDIPSTLASGSSFHCIIDSTAVEGQHTNTATVTGYYGNTSVSDSDNANYYGWSPAIDIEKYVSADQSNWIDADLPTGLDVMTGETVWFKFEAKNTGDVPLTGISINDNRFGPVTCADIPPTLDSESSFHCIIDSTAVEGQHTNTATVTGYYGNSPVSDEDSANYYGRSPAIDIEKEVSVDNRVTWHDADDPTGPEIEPGNEVYFRFTITNTGDIELTNLTLDDSDFDTSSCTMPDSLNPSQSYECIISSVAVEGQHTNTATATGKFRQTTVSDTDDANYKGRFLVPSVNVKKYVSADGGDSWHDADEPTGPDVKVDNEVLFKFVVTNDGETTLTDITLDDDKLDINPDNCTIPESLPSGESFECFIEDTAVTGQHVNIATAGGKYKDTTVEDSDPAHYHGCSPEIDLVYLVDFSGSMLWDDFGGTKRYEAARDAIIAMNKQMTEHGGGSRGALITFSDNQAGVQVGFTSDFNEIDTKLNEVEPISNSMTPTASGISEATDYLKNNIDPDHLPVVIFITDGVPNVDLAENKYSNYREDAKLITLYDDNDEFLDSSVVRQMGTDYPDYGTKGGTPWADTMDKIVEMKNAISDVLIYGVAVQGQDSFKDDLVEYAAHVSGGKSFNTANVNELQDSLTEILRDSTCFDIQSVLLKKYVSVDGSDKWKDADELGGPEVKVGDDVYYKIKVFNNGNEPVTNIHLSDTMYNLNNCNIPGTLGSGEFFECITGPFAAVEGQHTNTATVTANNSQSLVSDSDDANYTGTQYPPPGTPDNLEASMEANGVKLAWTPVADEYIKGYNVYRSLPDHAPALINRKLVTRSYYLDKSDDLVPETAYYYAVKSVNTFGNESGPSNMVSVMFGNNIRLVVQDAEACTGDFVSIPLDLENPDSKGIQSVYAAIRFDKDIVKVTKVALTGILTGEYLFEKNIDNENGMIVIAFAAKTDSYVAESGNIAEIQVEINENREYGDTTKLTFAEAETNDLPVVAKDGTIICPSDYNISGNISYFKDKCPVPNVTLTLSGDNSYTTASDSNGNYLFSDILIGDYTSVPSKTDDTENGLSAYDASKILKYVVRKNNPDCYQMIAADVNQDGKITATDASEVAICSGKRDLGLEYCMNENCVDWVFTVPMTDCDDWPPVTEYPSERTYDPLDKGRTKEDFVAILLGDVSKSWREKQNKRRRARSKTVRSESEVNAISGSSLTIPVVLDQETDIQAIDIVIQFDENLLEPKEVTLIGGILEDWEDNVQVIADAEGR